MSSQDPSPVSATSPSSPSVPSVHHRKQRSYGLDHNQLAEISEAFRMLENKERGGVTSEGLFNILSKHLGQHPKQEDLQEVVKNIDQKDNGIVEWPEFVVMMAYRIEEEELTEMTTAFEHFDKSKTGYVSAVNFKEMFRQMGEKSSEEEAEEMLQVADPDGTGKVDYHRFLRYLTAQCGGTHSEQPIPEPGMEGELNVEVN